MYKILSFVSFEPTNYGICIKIIARNQEWNGSCVDYWLRLGCKTDESEKIVSLNIEFAIVSYCQVGFEFCTSGTITISKEIWWIWIISLPIISSSLVCKFSNIFNPICINLMEIRGFHPFPTLSKEDHQSNSNAVMICLCIKFTLFYRCRGPRRTFWDSQK